MAWRLLRQAQQRRQQDLLRLTAEHFQHRDALNALLLHYHGPVRQ